MNTVFVFYDQQVLKVPYLVEPVLYCSPRTSFLALSSQEVYFWMTECGRDRILFRKKIYSFILEPTPASANFLSFPKKVSMTQNSSSAAWDGTRYEQLVSW